MNLEEQTRADEKAEDLRRKLLTDGCPPKLADEMVAGYQQAAMVNSLFNDLFKPRAPR